MAGVGMHPRDSHVRGTLGRTHARICLHWLGDLDPRQTDYFNVFAKEVCQMPNSGRSLKVGMSFGDNNNTPVDAASSLALFV